MSSKARIEWQDCGETRFIDVLVDASEQDSIAAGAIQNEFHVWDQMILIPPEHRPAVALALLGGLTDDLIERAAVWLCERECDFDDCGNYTHDEALEHARDIVRGVLQIAFGVAEDDE